MIENGDWWPEGWADSYPILQTLSVPQLDDNSIDRTMWMHNEGNIVKFSVNKAWKDMMPNEGKINWCKLVCYSHAKEN